MGRAWSTPGTQRERVHGGFRLPEICLLFLCAYFHSAGPLRGIAFFQKISQMGRRKGAL